PATRWRSEASFSIISSSSARRLTGIASSPYPAAVSLTTSSSVVTPFLTFSMPSDRKSTRLNSSHVSISYAVFCLKKKKKIDSLPTLIHKNQIPNNTANVTHNICIVIIHLDSAVHHRQLAHYDHQHLTVTLTPFIP